MKYDFELGTFTGAATRKKPATQPAAIVKGTLHLGKLRRLGEKVARSKRGRVSLLGGAIVLVARRPSVRTSKR